MVLHDGDVILEANAAFAEMFGFEEGGVTGRSMADFVAADTKRIERAPDPEVPKASYVLDAVRRDGETMRLEVCGRPTNLIPVPCDRYSPSKQGQLHTDSPCT